MKRTAEIAIATACLSRLWIVLSLLIIGVCFSNALRGDNDYERARDKTNALSDSAEVRTGPDEDTEKRLHNECTKARAKAEEELGRTYKSLRERRKAIAAYHHALHIYMELKNWNQTASVLDSLGDLYYQWPDYKKALGCFKISLSISEILGNETALPSVYNSIGSACKESGEYAEALNYFFCGLKKAETLKQEEAMGRILKNIAIVYLCIQKYPESFLYANQALRISKKINNQSLEIRALGIIGNKYFLSKQYPQALQLYTKALAVATKINEHEMVANLNLFIGLIFIEMKAYDQAGKCYEQAIEHSEKIKNAHYLSQAYVESGKMYLLINNELSGIRYIEKGLAIAAGNNMPTVAADIYLSLAEAYNKTNDYRKAYQNYSVYTALTDSMFKQEEQNAMQQLHFDHELDKKRQEIILLEKERIIKSEQDKTRGTLLLFLATTLCFATVIICVLVKVSRKRKKALLLIARQKTEIQKQASHLQQLNDLKTRTFSIISHDLRNPIAALSMLIELMNKNLISTGKFFEGMQSINVLLYSLNNVLENLLIWSKNQMEGRECYNPSIINLHKLAGQNIGLLNESARRKNILLVNDVAPNTSVFADHEHIDIVIRNLVANAIKFTCEQGEVRISSFEQEGKILVTVKDNGVGMNQELVKQLFGYTLSVSNYGTKGEQGTGLGLMICKEFISKNGGSISVESETGKGSLFTFDLPKAG